MIHRYKTSQTTVAGEVSWNSDDLKGMNLQLAIKPATATTVYDISMTDDDSIVTYQKKGLKGTSVDSTQFGLYGVYTVAITNSSANELFNFSIRFDEIMRR